LIRKLRIDIESWPIRGRFTISRGSKTEARVIVATIEEDGIAGRGEAVPYPRYGETVEGVAHAIETLREEIEGGMSRVDLSSHLGPGAARNALNCALWDLQAKKAGAPVWQLAGLGAPRPVITAYTISLDTPEAMAEAAGAALHAPLLKLKLGGGDGADMARMEAIRLARPDARLIVDANEGWTVGELPALMGAARDVGVELIEQPLPAGADDALDGLPRPVPLCADESVHDETSLARLGQRYDMINVKLDKTGGFTHALGLIAVARSENIGVFVGSMVCTSLGIAPAALLAGMADYADLDGPLLLARDRTPGLHYDGTTLHPPEPALWG
jgi:L-alanine-DL-glutamate epimerase-like enolase superfamily enzyme